MKTVQVLLLTAESCHLCDHAKAVLAKLAEEYPLNVSEMAITSPEGRRLAERDGVAIAPGTYLDGEFFAQGRLSSGRLRRRLGAPRP